jgi:hypothetical protein
MMQIIQQTDEEKIAMYMKFPKKEIIAMLIQCNKILDSRMVLSADDENVKKVREKYGKTHTIEAVKGTKVEMAKLAKNQSVCWGDGESYHFRLTAL